MLLTRPALLQLFAIILFFSSTAAAQTRFSTRQSSLINTFWIQYNPGTLLEPEIPVTATFLYKKSNRLGLALDAGFFVARQNYSSELAPYSGFRFKPEVKFYVEKKRDGPHGLYFSLQGLVKRTIKTNEEWLDQFDNSGQFVLSQFATYKERKLVLGLNLLFGGEVILGDQNRWSLDFYLGFGFRNKYFKALDLPPGINKDYRPHNGDRVFSIYQNGTYISLPAGMKIGYRLR